MIHPPKFLQFKKFWRARGFVLLLTVLIVSVVFAASLTTYNLIVGEILLSSGIQNSQISLYAAFSGIECVRFWELKHPGLSVSAFATSSTNSIANFCQGQTATPVVVGGTNNPSQFSLAFSNGSCVAVSVLKTGLHNQVVVTAQGQNTPCSEQSSRTVQRGLQDIF